MQNIKHHVHEILRTKRLIFRWILFKLINVLNIALTWRMKKYISVKLLRSNWLIRWNDNGTLKRFTCFTESMNDNVFLFLSPSCNLLHLKCQAGTDWGLSRNNATITKFISCGWWQQYLKLLGRVKINLVKARNVIFSNVIPSSSFSFYS